MGMAFFVDVTILGLRRACAVKSIISRDLLW